VQRKRLGYILIGGGLVMALSVGVMVYSQVYNAAISVQARMSHVTITTRDVGKKNIKCSKSKNSQ